MTTGLGDDAGTTAWRRATQEDPIVCHLVVARAAVKADAPHTLLAATLRASLLAAAAWGETAAWLEWEAESFRKVCLRATPSQVAQLARDEVVTAGPVGMCAPVHRSARSPVLAKMQALTAPVDTARVTTTAWTRSSTHATIVMPADWPCSLGKTLAQLSHAVLLSTRLWMPGIPLRLAVADRAVWDTLDTPYSVVDAGLTEVDPGTVTMRVVAPSTDAVGLALL